MGHDMAFKYNDVTGTLIIRAGGTADFQGNLYRSVPHSSQTPLSTDYAYNYGGRWNPPGTYPVMYTSTSVDGAKAFVDWQADFFGIGWADRAPEDQPDLLVLTFNATLADVATDSGLALHGLPKTYPLGYQSPSAWTITQPIGVSICATGVAGLVTRSASMSNWSGPITEWAEVAIFAQQAPKPVLVDRFAYSDWYSR